ncbi:MAG: sigma-70 family RNA polymerase sigma factor [Cyanobacteriota bacterium]|nr:sigma-70 family RNA polymerase sigma factor [Cyanobacteriota bacterium]
MNSCTGPSRRPHPGRPSARTAAARALSRRNALVEAHRHLVPPLALHYWRRCPEPQDDLIQVGLLGLIRAAELFRPSQQTPFEAFARPHIRGAILHYLRDDANAVRLPRRQAELQIKLRRLEEDLARRPSGTANIVSDICQRLEMSQEQWQLLQRHRQLCRPAPLEPELTEQLARPAEDALEESHESQARVERLLGRLDGRTERVVRLVVLQGWSYRRAAAALEVSAMTVQRCLERGLATLRAQLQHSTPGAHRPQPLNSGKRLGRAPSVAPGWPSRHSPPPAASPAHLARR